MSGSILDSNSLSQLEARFRGREKGAGKVGRAGGGVPGDGSGGRLFSRRCREATQVSANDLTHCKGGAVERLGAGQVASFSRDPPIHSRQASL